MSDDFRIILQPQAVDGIENGYEWIAADSPERAHKWLVGLMDAIDFLKSFPKRCALAPENDVFDEEIRQLLYGRGSGVYRILFAFKEDAVNVLYVRHGAQQWIVPEARPDVSD